VDPIGVCVDIFPKFFQLSNILSRSLTDKRLILPLSELGDVVFEDIDFFDDVKQKLLLVKRVLHFSRLFELLVLLQCFDRLPYLCATSEQLEFCVRRQISKRLFFFWSSFDQIYLFRIRLFFFFLDWIIFEFYVHLNRIDLFIWVWQHVIWVWQNVIWVWQSVTIIIWVWQHVIWVWQRITIIISICVFIFFINLLVFWLLDNALNSTFNRLLAPKIQIVCTFLNFYMELYHGLWIFV